MSIETCLIVMLGGALGTLARYVVSIVAMPVSGAFPWGTVLTNVTGCFIIGFFGTLTLAHGRFPVSENVRLFVMIGMCGGYTTFSSFSLQTLDLLRAGGVTRAMMNVALSVLLCICAVGLGHLAAAHFNSGAREIAQIALEEEA